MVLEGSAKGYQQQVAATRHGQMTHQSLMCLLGTLVVMGRALPAVQGSMYLVMGNGAFDPSRGAYGDSIIRVSLPELKVRHT